MNFWLILKLLTVFVFLVMFLRGSRLVWGVGLLTVTTAVLLDAVLTTFGREEIQQQLGFFFYVISGALFGGAAVWLWGLVRPLTIVGQSTPTPVVKVNPTPIRPPAAEQPGAVFDRQMLYDQIRQRLSPQDVLDLIFDLGLEENEVVGLNQDVAQVIVRLMDTAEERGQSGALALAVERILLPPTAEDLPRLEKLNADSPRTVLRHYLLSHYNLAQLEAMAGELGMDWEQLTGRNKKEKVRELLLFLYRRNRLGDLLALLHGPPASHPTPAGT
ncbi:MAG: hypothetical protein AB1791_04635 [Chloroflexota bacterium]